MAKSLVLAALFTASRGRAIVVSPAVKTNDRGSSSDLESKAFDYNFGLESQNVKEECSRLDQKKNIRQCVADLDILQKAVEKTVKELGYDVEVAQTLVQKLDTGMSGRSLLDEALSELDSAELRVKQAQTQKVMIQSIRPVVFSIRQGYIDEINKNTARIAAADDLLGDEQIWTDDGTRVQSLREKAEAEKALSDSSNLLDRLREDWGDLFDAYVVQENLLADQTAVKVAADGLYKLASVLELPTSWNSRLGNTIEAYSFYLQQRKAADRAIARFAT